MSIKNLYFKNMIKKLQIKTIVIIISFWVVFVYGFGVGKFSWFPHDTLSSLYHAIMTNKTEYIILRYVGYEIQIKFEAQSEIAFVTNVGKDENGFHLELASPLKKSYPPGAEVRLSDNEYLSEIKGSLDDLRELGFDVKHFTYPYNANDETTRELVSKYYESARASGGLDGHIRGVHIPNKPLNIYALYSTGIDMASEGDILAILEETLNNDALSIVYIHSDRTTERRIRYLINTAIEKGIDIITRSEVLEYFKNIGSLDQRPAIVIEYDDSPRTDYTLAFDVHKIMEDRHGVKVPGNIAVISDFIGRPENLTKAQIQEMSDAGWEVVSHTRSHAYLKSELTTFRRAKTYDTKIYVDIR